MTLSINTYNYDRPALPAKKYHKKGHKDIGNTTVLLCPHFSNGILEVFSNGIRLCQH